MDHDITNRARKKYGVGLSRRQLLQKPGRLLCGGGVARFGCFAEMLLRTGTIALRRQNDAQSQMGTTGFRL